MTENQKLREALRVALDALTFDGFCPQDFAHRTLCAEAASQLRQALALPTAEPVDGRERFEQFAQNCPMGKYNVARRGEGYDSSHTQIMWDAWQEAQAALRWQPIETAPKDGSDCWLLVDGDVRRGFWVEIEFEERRDMDGRYIDQADADAYWMDLDSGDSLEPTMFYPITKPLPPSLVDIDAAMRKDKL